MNLTKTGEVTVRRTEGAAVLDRERGQVRVGGQVAGRAGLGENGPQNVPVLVARPQCNHLRSREPSVHHGERLFQGERSSEDAGAGGYSEEPEQDRPREGDRLIR